MAVERIAVPGGEQERTNARAGHLGHRLTDAPFSASAKIASDAANPNNARRGRERNARVWRRRRNGAHKHHWVRVRLLQRAHPRPQPVAVWGCASGWMSPAWRADARKAAGTTNSGQAKPPLFAPTWPLLVGEITSQGLPHLFRPAAASMATPPSFVGVHVGARKRQESPQGEFQHIRRVGSHWQEVCQHLPAMRCKPHLRSNELRFAFGSPLAELSPISANGALERAPARPLRSVE